MSTARVELGPEVRGEINEALDWYLARSFHAAEAFEEELESAIDLVASSPSTWPLFEAGTRRYVFRRFPYSLIYQEAPDGIRVVALMHEKRMPGYWQGR
ncbi:MAG TPA: type II toxin-antitoxin system RelE/ParE family toxin [Thermoanaerobaculia bacterium]|nr:type II toxin-antitoxin system RelE/ParE family toxin [Thermoanaerobaculia bacterium]